MTLKEVAAEIGVSTYTVSCAINNRGAISPETRRRVLKKVQDMGYTPNVNAQRLVTGRSFLIALDDRRPGLFTDPFGMQLARGLQQALQAHGYGLLLNTATGSTKESDQVRRWVSSRTVDGVVIVRSQPFDSALIGEIAAARVPCVVIGTWLESVPYVASVGIQHTGLREASQLLVEQGHRRIGLINNTDARFEQTLVAELARHGVTLSTADIQNVPFPEAADAPNTEVTDGAEAMRALLERCPQLTAVLARSDALAIGAMRQATAMGRRIPEDLSIIGHEDVLPAEFCNPPLTSVRIDCVALGEAATAALLERMEDPTAVMPPRMVETRLVRRASVGTARS